MVIIARFPMGWKALFLDRRLYSSYFEEQELITYPNIQFQVTAKYNDDNYHIIEVELLTDGETDIEKLLAELDR